MIETVHSSDISWQEMDSPWSMQYKRLISPELCGAKEFVAGIAKIEPGATIPFHVHGHSQCDYIISGHAWAKLGKQQIEVLPGCAVYSEPSMPHAYDVVGTEPLVYFYIYACEKKGADILSTPSSQEEIERVNIINLSSTRWVCCDDFEPLQPFEPSKGAKRSLLFNRVFDSERGGHCDMMAGTLVLNPGLEFTAHTHEQPEVFYCVSGKASIYNEKKRIDVRPGHVIYTYRNCPHGTVNTGNDPFKQFWVYGREGETVYKSSWTPSGNKTSI
jgi:quercetin dioxygenase-like cupin family protein